MPKRRPITAATATTSRAAGSSRSSRACSTPCTSAGTSSAASEASHQPLSVAVQRAALDQVAQRLRQEQRIAAGALHQQADHAVGDRAAGQRGDQLLAGGCRPAAAARPRDSGAGSAGGHARPSATSRPRGRCGRASPGPPGRSRSSANSDSISSSVGSSAQCRSSNTISSGRSWASRRSSSATTSALRLADRLAAELAQLLGRLGVGLQAEHAGQERVGLAVVAEDARQRRLQVEPHPRLAGQRACAQPVAQQLAHRPVGEALRCRRARGRPAAACASRSGS